MGDLTPLGITDALVASSSHNGYNGYNVKKMGLCAVQINILEARNRLSQLIQSALAGEKVVIANRGKPVVELVPVKDYDDETGTVKPAKGFKEWLVENPLPERLRRSHEEIEESIQAERSSWD